MFCNLCEPVRPEPLACCIAQMYLGVLCVQCGQAPNSNKAHDSTSQLRSILKSIQPPSVPCKQAASGTHAQQSGKPATAYSSQAAARRPGFVAPLIRADNNPPPHTQSLQSRTQERLVDRKRDAAGRVRGPGNACTTSPDFGAVVQCPPCTSTCQCVRTKAEIT